MYKSLMCHIVAGYPDNDSSIRLLKGMENIGIGYVEIQVPFTDPIADGELIMQANDIAVMNGMTVDKTFLLVETLVDSAFKPEIFIMSYLQKIYHYGATEFSKKLKKYNITGLIVPDLPYDTPEFESIKQLSIENNIALVPVITPGIKMDRLHKLLEYNPDFVYLTSQKGTTGSKYVPTQDLYYLKIVRISSNAKILIGFGIRTREDVTNVLSIGDIAVVGSAIVKSLQETSISETVTYIKSLYTSDIQVKL